MVLNTTFNNISFISWQSVLLVEETGGTVGNHRHIASYWQTVSHNVVHLTLIEIRNVSGDRHWLHIGSWKSNYNTIQHYTIKFVSDLQQVSDFLRATHVSSTNKTDRHHITEILLKVMLNTVTLNETFLVWSNYIYRISKISHVWLTWPASTTYINQSPFSSIRRFFMAAISDVS